MNSLHPGGFFFFLVADLILLDAIERKLLFSWGYEMSGRM